MPLLETFAGTLCLSAPSLAYKFSWITMMSSNLLPAGDNFSFGFWAQKACAKMCVARNSCTHKVKQKTVFSWRRNKSPMQHFSECFCHIVLNMDQNIRVAMLIYRISLYNISAMHNSMSENNENALHTSHNLVWPTGLFQWKDCCKQCDNSERGCVPITAVPRVQTQSDMTLVLIIQHWMSRSCNTAM